MAVFIYFYYNKYVYEIDGVKFYFNDLIQLWCWVYSGFIK